MGKTLQGVFGALLLLTIAAMAWTILSAPREPALAEFENATLLPEPRVLNDFALFDERGMPFDQQDLRGRWTLMFFGFTHCPDVCPVTLQQLAAARNGLRKQGAKPLPEILFISVDPERDNPEALANYVANFGEGVKGASGEQAALTKLTRDLGIFFQREPGPAGQYQVSHSSAVLLINPRGELHAIFSAPQSTPALMHDIPVLMATL